MSYKVVFKKSASKEFLSLQPKFQQQVGKEIEALKTDPLHPGVRQLRGNVVLYRVRSGDFRVIFSVDHAIREVFIFRVADRKEAYR